MDGVGVIELDGVKYASDGGDDPLYGRSKHIRKTPQRIKLIPYYAWGNRGRNEMRVWLHYILFGLLFLSGIAKSGCSRSHAV